MASRDQRSGRMQCAAGTGSSAVFYSLFILRSILLDHTLQTDDRKGGGQQHDHHLMGGLLS